jgi:hypothetical protein
MRWKATSKPDGSTTAMFSGVQSSCVCYRGGDDLESLVRRDDVSLFWFATDAIGTIDIGESQGQESEERRDEAHLGKYIDVKKGLELGIWISG